MKSFYEKYKDNGHTQNGEWGIIRECLQRLGFVPSTGKDKYLAVEFGACDGVWCSNTVDVALTYRGWERLLFDINPGSITVIKQTITPENVNVIVPKECNILSIDCDGPDYGIWKAYEGQPEIVIIEINSSADPLGIAPYNDQHHGTNYLHMVRLGQSKGYFLLCHTGNLIFIRNEYRDKFPEIVGDGIENWEEYFSKSWLV